MTNISKEIVHNCQIAACIASDDFLRLSAKIRRSKVDKFSRRKIYEIILQSYLFCGFPATIESMKIFKEIHSDFAIKKSKYDLNKFRTSGIKNCKLIYKNNFKKLIANMNEYSPDLKEWMIVEGYGKVLGRSGLSLLEREFVNFSILSTKFYQTQLHSHAKGCLNLGATKEQLRKILDENRSIMETENFYKSLQLIDQI